MLSALTWLVYELLSCRFGRFRLHTSLRLRALIRSWQGVYVCKFRSTRTRFQFKKTLPGEHSPENFCCVGPHFQACMNLADVFCLRCFSEARKKHFRRNFRKCSRMRANVFYKMYGYFLKSLLWYHWTDWSVGCVNGVCMWCLDVWDHQCWGVTEYMYRRYVFRIQIMSNCIPLQLQFKYMVFRIQLHCWNQWITWRYFSVSQVYSLSK